MIVVLAAFLAAFLLALGIVFPGLQARARDPVSGVRVEIFVDPRDNATILTLESMALSVGFEYLEVVLLTHRLLATAIQEVGHGLQCYGRGKGPTRSVPLAFVALI